MTVLNIRFVNQPFGQILSELRNWLIRILSGAEKAWQIWLQDHAESLPFYPENAPDLNYTLLNLMWKCLISLVILRRLMRS